MRLLWLFLLAFCLACPESARAAKPAIPKVPPIAVTYDVYVGGVHLLAADVVFQEKGNSYQGQLKGHTYGFWYRLLPWNTTLGARGQISGDRFVPQEFASHDVWSKKMKTTKLHFGKNGDVTPTFEPPSHDENREIVTQAQRRGTLDPVTALLQMLAYVAVHDNCNVTVPVFDGKRRFDITGMDAGTENLAGDEYGMFNGRARACDASFTMISGEWKDREKSRFWQKSETEAGRAPFHIWLGKVSPRLPELPVKLESDSVFGPVIVHLSQWHYAASGEFVPQVP